MKKYIGKNEKGEIVYYEELKDIKDIKELEGVKEFKKEKKIPESRTDFFNYWFIMNWNTNVELRYQGSRFILFILKFPFIFIKRCFLIIFKKDWGENYKNFSDFVFKKIIPTFLFCLILYCFPGQLIIKTWKQTNFKQEQKKEKLEKLLKTRSENTWKKENEIRKGNGEVYLGPKIGWYKIQDLPKNYKPEGKMNDFTNPPGWKN